METASGSNFRYCIRCKNQIESERARHAKYCCECGNAFKAKVRRVDGPDTERVMEWRKANASRYRLMNTRHVREHRARKKIQRLFDQEDAPGPV